MLDEINDKQILLPNGKEILLNDEQYEGIKKIRVWLKGNKTFFTLAGFSGSGKSTIVKKIIDEYSGRIAVSATTHRAKVVISNTTGIEGITIHGILGLRPDCEISSFNPNDPTFAPIAKPLIDKYSFIIVDEASMINLELFELIQKTAENLRIKILFVGDSGQIPPIGEKISAVFCDDTIEIFWLYKSERQTQSNPLLPIFDIIRNNLNQQTLPIPRTTNINENNEGVVFFNNKIGFRNAVIEKFNSPEYRENVNFCKILAWRNDTVMKSNNTIRKILFGANAKQIEIGDALIGYRSIMDKQRINNIVQNSCDYKVSWVSELTENNYGVFGFNVKLREDIKNNEHKYQDVFIVDSYDENNLHTYAEMHDFLRDEAKKNKIFWNRYYDFRRNNMLMTNISKHRNGNSRNSADVVKKDLDYSFTTTAHKAQGSTFNFVFLLEQDILLNKNIKERNQIFYTAISRPQICAYVLTI